MNWFRIATLAVIASLMLSGETQAYSTGIQPGDSMTYSYTIFTTYATANGNISSTTTVDFQVSVLLVNTSTSLGNFGYTENIISLNNTAVTSATGVKNLTTIFNPFDNMTYTGNIGFWPVIYTDLQPNSVKNLILNESYNDYNGSGYIGFSAEDYINASLTRSEGLIDVNLTIIPIPTYERPAIFYISYNATTGVMESMKQYTNVEVEKIFTYNLLDFTTPSKSYLYLVGYAILGIAGVVLVVEVVRRKSKEERRDARIREKYKKSS